MMFKCFRIFLAAACSIGGVLVTGCNTDRKPEIAFESISHEFPNFFIVGSKITKRFDFTNKGNAPLEIQDIQSHCGCVATTPSAAQIPPGGTSTILMEIDRDTGPFKEQAFVYTNDPDKPMIPLQVSGVIKSAVTYPKKIDFGQYEKGQNVSKTVKLTNNLTQSVEITAHTMSDNSLAVTIPEGVISPGESLEIQAILSLRKVGFYSEALTLSIKASTVIPGTHSETLELSIQFQGRVLGGIVALPANLFLGVMPRSHPVQRTLQLKTDGTHAFSVLGITADKFEVSVETSEEKQRSHDLFLAISVAGIRKGFLEDTLSIQTNHPEVKTIEIPVKGVVQ